MSKTRRLMRLPLFRGDDERSEFIVREVMVGAGRIELPTPTMSTATPANEFKNLPKKRQ